ncbi:MAG: 50S ribosomal protein L22 [Puniceicoccales bacterium]|jgi:large subunit ribosomal protein L22|nr:50S ribosomal protein L22 [Puniceicoccales bacterium]
MRTAKEDTGIIAARALARQVRMSPKKVREVVRCLPGRLAGEALDYLCLIPRKSAFYAAKTLRSAMANADVRGLSGRDLWIKEAVVEQGLVMKRFIPAARGSAHPIRRRSSRIRFVLAEKLED